MTSTRSEKHRRHPFSTSLFPGPDPPSNFLGLERLDETTEELANGVLDDITSLKIRKYARSVDLFFILISRCPNLITIWCSDADSLTPSTGPPPNVAPHLSCFYGSLKLARLLTPGRPLTEVTIIKRHASNEPTCSVGNLEPLSHGIVKLQLLNLSGFVWEDGCLETLATLFPHLITLKLDVTRTHDESFVPKVSVRDIP